MAHHQPQGGLTWYQGSIPPYASLWHTLVRLGALNCLSLSELPEHPANHQLKRALRSTWYPLFNEINAIDTHALATALGEPPISLRLSHLGGLAPWVHSLFTKHLRFCRSCFSQGYHTSLFSLKLLLACPIHNEPLDDCCPCGRVICNRLSSGSFQQFCRCASHTPNCIGPENCRIPRIPIGLTHALDGIATWLEDLSTLIRPLEHPNAHYAGVVNPIRLDAAQWCDVFGIRYPGHLNRSATQRHLLHIVRGGPFKVGVSAPLKSAIRTTHNYWKEDSPSTWTYRAICRHLRRHFARQNSLLGTHFAVPKDCTFIIAKVAHDPKLAAAFTEARWAMHLERNVRERRWPYRAPWADSQHQFIGQLKLFDSPDWQSLNRPVRIWLEYHWAAYCMLSVWAYYEGRSKQMADSAVAEQSTKAFSLPDWDWAAKIEADGSVLFACHRQNAAILPTRHHTPKYERIHARQAMVLQRAGAFEDACKGPCLTWSQHGGWRVSMALSPLFLRYSRNALWGPFKNRPKFWLYPVHGGFAARLENVALQVQEETPGKTISSLRTAYAQYERTYPTALR